MSRACGVAKGETGGPEEGQNEEENRSERTFGGRPVAALLPFDLLEPPGLVCFENGVLVPEPGSSRQHPRLR